MSEDRTIDLEDATAKTETSSWRQKFSARIMRVVFPRLFETLEKSSRRSTELAAERETLVARTQGLQVANLSLQRRAIYLDASAQVSRTLTTIFDVQPLLEQAVTAISHHFEFYHVGVFLLDDTGEWAALRAASSMVGRQMVAQGYRQKRGSASLVGQAVATSAPLAAVAAGNELPDFAMPELPGARSAAALPLIAAETLLGVLEVQSTEDAAFDQDSIRALEGLAGQLAVALNNAHSFSEGVSVLEAKTPSYRLVRSLATVRTEMDVYEAVLTTVNGFSPAQAFVVRMPYSANTSQLVAELRDGKVDVQNAADLQSASVEAVLAVSRYLEAPLWIPDLTAPLDTSQATFQDFCNQLVAQSDIRSVALVPVRVESDLFGVLMVAYHDEHYFTPLETQLYWIIEDLGGAALARIQLVHNVEVRVERERWLREFGERVMRMPDLDTMMAQAAQSLQDAVQADGVVVSIALPESDQLRQDDERI